MPPLPFDKHLDIRLIKLVEAHPILYNTKHEKYLESDSRDSVWQKISAELDRPASLCKTRWINIRDNMRRKIRERERRPNLKLKKYHPNYKYKYEDDLAFVVPFFKVFQSLEDGENYNENVNFAIDDDESGIEQVYIDNDDEFDLTEAKPDVSSLLLVRDKDEGTSSSKSGMNCSVSTSQERVDPITVFLDAVGSTLRNLNPYYLNQAKGRIFQVVQDCELQQIVNKGKQPPNDSDR